jgi:redox-sensitive bicupin YhaK (pirin superfamily)
MRSLFRTLVLTALIAAVACGGDDDDPIAPVTNESVVGVWTLRGVNGDPLPFPLAQTVDIKLEVRSGTVTLGADRSFLDVQELRIYRTGQATVTRSDTLRGTWSLTGNEMTVALSSGGEMPVLFLNNQLLKLESSFTYTYRK